MRKILLPLLMIPLMLNAQSKQKYHSSFEIVLSPIYSNIYLSNKNFNQSTEFLFGYQAGILTGTTLGKKVNIYSGFIYQSRKFKHLATFDSENQINGSRALSSQMQNTVESCFLNIPIYLTYCLFESKITVSIYSGIVYNKFINCHAQANLLYTDGKKEEIKPQYEFKKFDLGFPIGLQTSVMLTQKIGLCFYPGFEIYTNEHNLYLENQGFFNNFNFMAAIKLLW